MESVTARQTDEGLLAEALMHLGIPRADVERFPNMWSVEGDLLTIRTPRGALRWRRGDGDTIRCSQGHLHPRSFNGCLQCAQRAKHAPDVDAAAAARDLVERIQLQVLRRKQRVEALRSGAPPSPSRQTWGERGGNW